MIAGITNAATRIKCSQARISPVLLNGNNRTSSVKMPKESQQDSPKTFAEAFLRLIWGRPWAPYFIVLVLVMSAILTVWSVFKPDQTNDKQNQNSSSEVQLDNTQRKSVREDANQDVEGGITLNIDSQEKLAATWFSALREGKADTLVSVSSNPFYDALSGEVYLTEDDLHAFYSNLISSLELDGSKFNNYAFEVHLLLDLAKKEGVRETTRRNLEKMSIRQDDILVFLWIGEEGSRSGVGLFSRWFDGELRVMGVDFY